MDYAISNLLLTTWVWDGVPIIQDKVEENTKSSGSWANGLSNLPAPSFLKDPKSRRHVSRPPEVVKARSDIPIVMMEQEIMEAINENSTVIIRGETGCGKTTQVPQVVLLLSFLLSLVYLVILIYHSLIP
jgi:HrpA-like RNA helicase